MNIGGLFVEDYNQYISNTLLIIELVKKFYSNEQILVKEPQGLDFYELEINSKIKVTILPKNTWKDIKNSIDSKLYNLLHINICRLCDMEMKSKTACNQCNFECCIECYIKNFRKNKGIIKCTNCAYSFGTKTPDKYIDILVEDIRTRANELKIRK